MKHLIPFMKSEPLVNVVRLQGAISNSSSGLDDVSLAGVLEKAFTKGKPAAVALQINCPGGSPVQSSLIAARIERLSKEKEIPVIAFVEDVAASGGYWLACAAEEIYIDQASLVGSIGVISAGFGLNEAIGKVGVERLHIAQHGLPRSRVAHMPNGHMAGQAFGRIIARKIITNQPHMPTQR